MKFKLDCGCVFELRKKVVFAEPIEWYLDTDSRVHKVCKIHDKQLSLEEYERYEKQRLENEKLRVDWVKEILKIEEKDKSS